MLSGNGSGLYDAHEWPELARSLVTLLVVLANDDDEWDYEDDSYHHHDSFCEDDLGISVPQAQFDVGLSYFISPSLAVGARYLFSEDFRDNELSRLWGGGPELTLFMGQDASRIRPFVGGGLMYTRGRSRRGAAEFEDGTALHWRAGVHFPVGPAGGLVVQGGWRDDRFPVESEPLARRVAGIGVGFTARFN
ncbi:MAG: hypothetical protein HOM68_22890 [Gemmatimonadetes bacterium]|nr:hypothetical protein [Gemmatimonadota bacterium]MBT5059409.1 hypothetical protein [Gemmatimonadota bacterium]MBT5146296.1 hypothetical protein [Gemmatimonadota bacterium]MBT5591219.1 hypothetical protein [Gemmatimonadota bacterium]MBT5962326.1 hypothetical protein [Gemmatimonadota bacterium]